MTRLLMLVGALSGYAAWRLAQSQARAVRNVVPAREAAALLQQAWSDHHTRA